MNFLSGLHKPLIKFNLQNQESFAYITAEFSAHFLPREERKLCMFEHWSFIKNFHEFVHSDLKGIVNKENLNFEQLHLKILSGSGEEEGVDLFWKF